MNASKRWRLDAFLSSYRSAFLASRNKKGALFIKRRDGDNLVFIKKMLIAGLMTTSATVAAAEKSYPTHEITMVINFGAGGSTDVATRVIARGMEHSLNVPIISVNKPGANGTIGPAYLKNQRPDGYSIGVLTSSTHSIAPYLMKLPYALDDFSYIGAIGSYRFGLVVKADSPYKTIADLVAAAKKDDGLFFGSPSAANTLAGVDLARVTGGRFDQINYKSGTEVMTALLSGHIQAAIQNPGDILPHLKAGSVRLLASAGPQRWSDYPDVPTLKELGFDMQVISWLTLAAPKNTPTEIVDQLRKAAFNAVDAPDVQTQLQSLGFDPVKVPGKEVRNAIREAYLNLGPSIDASKLPRVEGTCFVDCDR